MPLALIVNYRHHPSAASPTTGKSAATAPVAVPTLDEILEDKLFKFEVKLSH